MLGFVAFKCLPLKKIKPASLAQGPGRLGKKIHCATSFIVVENI